MELKKVQEELEFINKIGEFDLFKVVKDEDEDLLESTLSTES